MMRFRDSTSRSYCMIAACLGLLLSASPATADYWQARAAALLGSSWNWLSTLAITSQVIGNRPLKAAVAHDNRRVVSAKEEIQRLELENRQLKERLIELQTLLVNEQALVRLPVVSPEELSEAQQRRRLELQRLTADQLASVPARVIYRAPTSWNSTLWLNVGTAQNAALGREVVTKNSPVVVGSSLIGVVDLVNAHQCRVRLITDSSLVPAVRVRRQGQLLAKGELHGSGLPLWRHDGRILQGIGFNYDFADEEGPARDLRSGRPVGQSQGALLALVEVSDTLVTSGLDGLFPAGLEVAEVTALRPLREGDYFFELEAQVAAGDLDALSLVAILPPVTSEKRVGDF
jgi:rod shape-determining protein MreC